MSIVGDSIKAYLNYPLFGDTDGGTADITVHEKLADSKLRELHKASGGPWGGMYVDNNYLAWLEKLFGEKAVDGFKKENMEDYFDLLREFETKKRSVMTQSKDAITFRISASLREKSEEIDDEFDLEDQLNRLSLTNLVSIKRDKMRVDPEVVRSWFKGPVNNVVSHVNKIIDEPKMRGVNTILLVGGFGESQYVHDVFQNSFPLQNLIVPAESGLAVLKGAVRFGHEPNLVSSRVMQYTYGIRTTGPFDESIHSVSDLIEVNGNKVVDNVFRTFVRAGEIIPTGHEITEKGYKPLYLDRNPTMKVYCSTDPFPKSTRDPGCKKLGEFMVDLPDGKTASDKTFDIIFVFGETELMVKARVQKTCREFYTTINCLK